MHNAKIAGFRPWKRHITSGLAKWRSEGKPKHRRALTVYGSSGLGTPNPPLRQVAGRYVQYALLLWFIER